MRLTLHCRKVLGSDTVMVKLELRTRYSGTSFDMQRMCASVVSVFACVPLGICSGLSSLPVFVCMLLCPVQRPDDKMKGRLGGVALKVNMKLNGNNTTISGDVTDWCPVLKR